MILGFHREFLKSFVFYEYLIWFGVIETPKWFPKRCESRLSAQLSLLLWFMIVLYSIKEKVTKSKKTRKELTSPETI